ncbi:MAG: alpha/beta hydrolase [Hyphomicrobiaceae bacterium]|nr:alpha/beta hydrolase [Hyphomicrobiaceae bacterium]
MSDAIVWNGRTQAEHDAAYNNLAAVAKSSEWVAQWTAQSAARRAIHPTELDIAYGPGPRNRFDVLRCGKRGAPLVVFIHGGWWQRNSKEMFTCMAEGPLGQGLDFALIGYTLAPEARLTDIAGEIRSGLSAIAAYQSARGLSQTLVLSGWSAGGHLAALCLDHPAVSAGLSISGVFDLEPIRHTYINDKLGLDAAEAAAQSPSKLPLSEKPLLLAYGTAELPDMQAQSVAFAQMRGSAGLPGGPLPIPGADHFSIFEAVRSVDGELSQGLARLAAGTF